jgi:glycosyltransferase involved in cell wall biosynthesis
MNDGIFMPSFQKFDDDVSVAVVIPCYNEALAIDTVVRDFRTALPKARICVFDNNSSDGTAEIAQAAGAEVFFVQLQGKGNVIRRMFADVDADIYVMADGDATYDAASAPKLIHELQVKGCDMVVGVRKDQNEDAVYRQGHRLGNKMLTGCVSLLFGGEFTDMLSGYRVFSRRYAKSYPAIATGFETETELTVHALELRMPWSELDTPYGARPEGSVSKLSTYRDGFRILRAILTLFVTERPLQFFVLLASLLTLIAIGISLPLLATYLHTHEVPRFPTAILAVGIEVIAALSIVYGGLLAGITHSRREVKRLFYLSIPGPGRHG